MAGPLDGLRVVDCSRGTAGPRMTGLLADYGADVVWVEPPGGDPYREHLAVLYSVLNRGKRSLTIDLRDASGADAARALLAGADLFVSSWRPDVAERLGLGYARLHGDLPGLVYCSISGFGVDGPYRDLPGYESLVHAVVGTMGEQKGHRPPPIYQGLPFASIGAALLAAIGVLGALLRRCDDQGGRLVETSLLDGALAYLSMTWADDDLGSPPLSPEGRRLVVRSVQCGDGEYLGVHTGARGAFDRLMVALGLSEHFPADSGGPSAGIMVTQEQARILQDGLSEIFGGRPRAEWLSRLAEADVCAIPELHPGEIFDEPQPGHNGMIVKVDDQLLGPVEQVGPPIRMARTPHVALRPAPTPGQHDGLAGDVFAGEPWHDPRRGGTPAGERPLLDNIRIVDIGAFYAGPYASRLLADLGADVIKVEPLEGDQMRPLDRSFGSAQAGKRSIAVNLKDETGRTIARRLATSADVVTHNMRPGAAERLGMGYEQVRQDKPDVVYLYAPGWGADGPYRAAQSFAPMMSGYVGASFEVTGRNNPPVYPIGNEDPGNGLVGAVAMLMALVHRRRTGHGQYVETPQLNSAMTHMSHIVRQPDGTILGAGSLDSEQLGLCALDRLYETADGWLCLVVDAPAQLDALASALGDPQIAERDGRRLPDDELSGLIKAAMRKLPTDKALKTLRASGVAAAVPTPRNDAGFLTDPENHRTRRAAECPHPVRGHVREVDLLVRVNYSSPPPHRLAPGLGQDTEEILGMIGETGRIGELRESHVVR